MTRGVLYIVWGNYNRKELQRSIASLEPWDYDYHVAEIENRGIGLSHKAQMYDLSPFDSTLFLDTDTVVRGNLDFGFEMAEHYGMACCIAPATSAYLAAQEIGMKVHEDLPQLNTGVIFFSRSDIVETVMNDWVLMCRKYPQCSTNDQPAFSDAVAERINPYILPRTWNYRAKVRYEARLNYGPVKILHSR